jgi:uncharacterized protein YukJ
MPLSEGYAVLKGRAIERKQERDDKESPHYHILVEASGSKYHIPVNVKSVKQPYDLLVFIDKDFRHPITNQLTALKEGLNSVPPTERKAGGIALDFIRSNLFNPKMMRPVRADLPGREDDVNDLLELIIQQIMKNSNVDIYAFGEPIGPKDEEDTLFKFRPLRVVHNIHMNQGNGDPRFQKENGTYQDGALFIHFRDEKRWTAFFSAFQSQSFHTDDLTGHPLDTPSVGPEPDSKILASLKIVGAKVNPLGEDAGQETVILLNTTSAAINLTGWVLSDRQKRKLNLKGQLEGGQPLVVNLSGRDVQLDNNGGTLTLLNPQGIKVDGVSYTKAEAINAGQTIVF